MTLPLGHKIYQFLSFMKADQGVVRRNDGVTHKYIKKSTICAGQAGKKNVVMILAEEVALCVPSGT